ncbi:unnamed protein product [Urochloa decumbens]|uniref:Uncharacterized protein n=1 Tax=Urochloa decumbens TaxID=240449 RepID=A0ABC9DFI9_9POAL
MTLFEITMFVLCVAVAGLHVLNLLLQLLQRAVSSHRSPVLVSIAGLFVPLAFATAYNMGVLLVYLLVAPAPAALVSPAAWRRFAMLACAIASALLLLLATPLVRVLFLGAGF